MLKTLDISFFIPQREGAGPAMSVFDKACLSTLPFMDYVSIMHCCYNAGLRFGLEASALVATSMPTTCTDRISPPRLVPFASYVSL